MTFLGVAIPCIILELFGMALTIAYKGVGGGDLLSAVLQPLGAFGTFCLVLLALSIIANNIPNDYSLGLCVQVLGKGLQRVNRAVWTLIGAVLYVTIAVLAASNFNDTLTNFLLLVAYWLGPWTIILVVEHFVFRHGKYSEYNVEDWNRPSKLPVGWAAIVAMAFGLVAVYLGASQFLFTGPLAKALGGMDIGFELGVIVAGVVYFFLRRVELAQAGR
jgi:purine-cytosine permease-like protein